MTTSDRIWHQAKSLYQMYLENHRTEQRIWEHLKLWEQQMWYQVARKSMEDQYDE